MLLDDDINIKKDVLDYVKTRKQLRRNIKAYVGWALVAQKSNRWDSYRFKVLLREIYFDGVMTGGFSISLDDKIQQQINQDINQARSTLNILKMCKYSISVYTDIIYEQVLRYIEEHDIDIRNYLIRYKNR